MLDVAAGFFVVDLAGGEVVANLSVPSGPVTLDKRAARRQRARDRVMWWGI